MISLDTKAQKYEPVEPARTIRAGTRTVDFSSPRSVAARVRDVHADMFPDGSGDYIDDFFREVEEMFAGNSPGFQAMDTAYHDIVHTMQATLCLVTLLHNRHRTGTTPRIDDNDFRKALIAILFHDIGFLKEIGDNEGTGAKYTHVHEKRSCQHARTYLGRRNWPEADIASVQTLITCTGPRSDLTKIPFKDDTERLLGQCVCTADYIGQMSDPEYVEKLSVLFKEFEENFRYQDLPQSEWPFKTYEELLKGTPAFWDKFVTRKMTHECGGVWKYFVSPETREDAYLSAVRENIERVRHRIARLDSDN